MANAPAPDPLAALAASREPWTPRRFFDALGGLGWLRIITVAGPSTFEALCEFGPYGIARGTLNAITAAYHWHIDLARFRHLRSRDEIHERSGRRVLFFELRESDGAPPFARIYLHREKGAAFAPDLERAFAALHDQLESGCTIEAAEDTA